MSNELIYGIGGLAAGYFGRKIIIKASCPEVVSTPLLTTSYVVPAPTMADYLFYKEWGVAGERKIKDFWNSNLVSDGTNIYTIIFWWDPVVNTITADAQMISPTFQAIGHVQLPVTSNILGNTINVLSNDSNVSMSIDTANYTVTSTIGSPSVSITHHGHPFIFNGGNDAVVVPHQSYLRGMEFPGNTTGTLTGIPVDGMGTLERLNWNFYEFSLLGYRWVSFNTNDNSLSGTVSQWGLYQDGGIWYNNTYYKLNYLDISIVTRTIDGHIADERVTASATDSTGTESIFILDLSLIYSDLNGIREYYNMNAYFNGTLIGTGFAWQDSASV